MKFCNIAILFAVIIGMTGAYTSAGASPTACRRSESSMYINSDAVVEAVVKQSRRWSEGETLHLVVKYKIMDVFKGDVNKDEILIVTDTCLDEPIPREMMGYPIVKNYCRGRIGLNLTGVNSRDGKLVIKSDNKPSLILFVRKDIRKGVSQLTWLEVSRTSFYGGCRQNRNDIPPEERGQFDRLQERFKYIGSR